LILSRRAWNLRPICEVFTICAARPRPPEVACVWKTSGSFSTLPQTSAHPTSIGCVPRKIRWP